MKSQTLHIFRKYIVGERKCHKLLPLVRSFLIKNNSWFSSLQTRPALLPQSLCLGFGRSPLACLTLISASKQGMLLCNRSSFEKKKKIRTRKRP